MGDKQDIDEVLNNFFKGTGLENTSPDFTMELMQKLTVATTPLVYKPLITRKTWYIILIVALVIFFATAMGAYSSELSATMSHINLDLSILNSLSDIVSLAIVALFILVLAQITFITKILQNKIRYS
ncbi:MAG: hypothetical protein COA58_06105 [Bacteroidetes bacterium]|nr:MAG: hypothetical protein COA58_06105 [Bacteroidota bacterium]